MLPAFQIVRKVRSSSAPGLGGGVLKRARTMRKELAAMLTIFRWPEESMATVTKRGNTTQDHIKKAEAWRLGRGVVLSAGAKGSTYLSYVPSVVVEEWLLQGGLTAASLDFIFSHDAFFFNDVAVGNAFAASLVPFPETLNGDR